MNLNLNEKVVLVTGSSKGIGFGIAKCFIQEGAQVVITGRDEEALKQAHSQLGEKSSYHQVDFTDENAIKNLKDKVIKKYERIDTIICNVGSGKSVAPGSENIQEWHKVFDLNFYTTINTIEIFKEEILKFKTNITCISSICAHEALGAPVAYNAAKAALNNYINSISRFFGPNEVRINAISPGNIFFEGSTWDYKLKENPKMVKEMLESRVPLRKLGKPEDIGNMAVYLASDVASFITGAVFVIDGGQTAII